jgi:hypothetical protein
MVKRNGRSLINQKTKINSRKRNPICHRLGVVVVRPAHALRPSPSPASSWWAGCEICRARGLRRRDEMDAQNDGTGTPVLLNVYDLTPVNDYLYWLGFGVFHSGIEGIGSFFPHFPYLFQRILSPVGGFNRDDSYFIFQKSNWLWCDFEQFHYYRCCFRIKFV